MPRYWLIAPVDSKPEELFDKVWRFDVANKLISIGWKELGDISNMSRQELSAAIAAKYRDKPPSTQTLYKNMLWAFYHEINSGDIVLARRGRKILAAVGKVIKPAYYAPGKNPDHDYPNYLEVEWQEKPRNIKFQNVVFPMQTVNETSEEQYQELVVNNAMVISSEAKKTEVSTEDGEEEQETFGLEAHLEDFIVNNFDSIFKNDLEIYQDGKGKYGQQFPAGKDRIDILSMEPKTNSYVVIELKRKRSSDEVIGQVLRYMGWVKQNLCQAGQTVKGLIICHDVDPKLSYALEMTCNIEVRYYSVSFKLEKFPNPRDEVISNKSPF